MSNLILGIVIGFIGGLTFYNKMLLNTLDNCYENNISFETWLEQHGMTHR